MDSWWLYKIWSISELAWCIDFRKGVLRLPFRWVESTSALSTDVARQWLAERADSGPQNVKTVCHMSGENVAWLRACMERPRSWDLPPPHPNLCCVAKTRPRSTDKTLLSVPYAPRKSSCPSPQCRCKRQGTMTSSRPCEVIRLMRPSLFDSPSSESSSESNQWLA